MFERRDHHAQRVAVAEQDVAVEHDQMIGVALGCLVDEVLPRSALVCDDKIMDVKPPTRIGVGIVRRLQHVLRDRYRLVVAAVRDDMDRRFDTVSAQNLLVEKRAKCVGERVGAVVDQHADCDAHVR